VDYKKTLNSEFMINTFFTFVSISLCFSLFGADNEKPLPKEFGALMVLAKKGNTRAQFAVGQRYSQGALQKND
tara:strand:- start:428 stop:646 length:219 start_codon:yes stop_codon:yes gene_type:complete